MATFTTQGGTLDFDGFSYALTMAPPVNSGTELTQAVADDIIEFDQLTMTIQVQTGIDLPVDPTSGQSVWILGNIEQQVGGSPMYAYTINIDGPMIVSQENYDGTKNLQFKVSSNDTGNMVLVVEQILPVSHDKILGYNAVAFLKNKIENAYTAGTNINISSGVISSTIQNFTGTDGVDPGTAGLVPAPTTSDTDKYLKSDGTWATVSGGGGGGGTLYSGTGQNTDGAMTQKATTDMVFNSNTKTRIQIGSSASANANNSVAIGASSAVNSNQNCVAIGTSAKVTGSSHTYSTSLGSNTTCAYAHSVALGSYANPRAQGVVDVSTGNTSNGYQGTGEGTRSKLRVISGVHAGENDNDVATVGQVKNLAYKLVTVDPGQNNTPADFIGQIAILYNEPVSGVQQVAARFMCTLIDGTQSPTIYNWQTF